MHTIYILLLILLLAGVKLDPPLPPSSTIKGLLARGLSAFCAISTHRTRFTLTIPLSHLGPVDSQDVYVDIDKVWFPFHEGMQVEGMEGMEGMEGKGEDPILKEMYSEDPQKERPNYIIGEVEFAQYRGKKGSLSAVQKGLAMEAVFKTLHIDPQPVRGKVTYITYITTHTHTNSNTAFI
jgi:hypothetical protein